MLSTIARAGDEFAEKYVVIRSKCRPDSTRVECCSSVSQPAKFKDDIFTVNVAVPEGFDQAGRRATGSAVQRAREWNAENAGGNLRRRPEGESGYRIVSIGLTI